MKFLKLIGLYTCPLTGLALLGRHIPPPFFLAICITSVLLTYALLWRSLSSKEIRHLPSSKWDGLMKTASWFLVGIMGFSLIYGLWTSRELLSESLIALPIGVFMNLTWVFSGMFSVLRRTNGTLAGS
jgi:hypothetical protein